jgi:hypothetical protein
VELFTFIFFGSDLMKDMDDNEEEKIAACAIDIARIPDCEFFL